MLNIKNKPVVVVGGGKIAARKIKGLLIEKANVTVISPSLHEDIDNQAITWIKRCYQKGDLGDAFLVFACTNQQDVNEQVMQDAPVHQLVNNTGNKFHSDFYNVALLRQEDFSISISTDGLSPQRSKEIRKKLENILPNL
nr:bifunctional precorrin-2 dehydrogenase/sirohydrochlorin ferrochelatase [Granulicatella sp. WM01]